MGEHSPEAPRTAIRIPEYLRPFVYDAVDRLRYLHPECIFETESDCITVVDAELRSEVRRDIFYALYRAKISHVGADARSQLLNTLLGR